MAECGYSKFNLSVKEPTLYKMLSVMFVKYATRLSAVLYLLTKMLSVFIFCVQDAVSLILNVKNAVSFCNIDQEAVCFDNIHK